MCACVCRHCLCVSNLLDVLLSVVQHYSALELLDLRHNDVTLVGLETLIKFLQTRYDFIIPLRLQAAPRAAPCLV